MREGRKGGFAPAALSVLLLLLAACAGRASSPGRVHASAAAASGGDLAACSLSLLGRGPLVLPPGKVDGLDVGELSALARLEGDRYIALVDNQKGTPARAFLLDFRVGPDGPAPLPGRSAGQVAAGAVRLAGFDGESFDGEGIVKIYGTDATPTMSVYN